MAEYIDRESAIAWFMPYAHEEKSIDADVVISDIKGMKDADVALVWHGHWKCHGDCGVTECSVCGWSIEEYIGDYAYCPNCGAKMDGGDGNDDPE